MVAARQTQLSNSKCYAYTLRGEKLFEGIFTNQAMWRMRKMEFINRHNLREANRQFYSRAVGAWVLCDDLHHSQLSFDSTKDSIMESWANYMATHTTFQFVSNAQIREGITIAVLGWYSAAGDVHIYPVALMSCYALSEKDFRRMAQSALRSIAKANPDCLPSGYFIEDL